MLLYETKLIMSSNKRNIGTKKISFDPNTTANHVGVSNGTGPVRKMGLKPGVSNGVGLTNLKTGKKTQTTVQIKGQASTRTELGSPWGVLLKPVPSSRKTEAQEPVEKPPVPKIAVPKLSFKGPHDVEQLKFNKPELKNIQIVKNKTEVGLRIVFNFTTVP